MIHKFIDNIFEMEKPISKLVKQGLIFSMLVCLSAVMMFFIQRDINLPYIFHDASLILLRTGITFAISFIVCGIATNTIKNQ